jgi:mycothiol system anti-sigma-R factor
MLSCEQVLADIWVYLDREIKETEIVHIQAHLELCRACFSRVEFEKLLRASMQKKTNHGCPEQVKSRIKNILEQF